jgi:hypothetical protein
MRVADEQPQQPVAAGVVADRLDRGLIGPVVDEPIDAVALAQHPQSGIACLGHLGGAGDHALQDLVQVQLSGEGGGSLGERRQLLRQ